MLVSEMEDTFDDYEDRIRNLEASLEDAEVDIKDLIERIEKLEEAQNATN